MFPLYFRPIGISHLGRILCSKGRPCPPIGATERSDADASRAALAKSPGISYIYRSIQTRDTYEKDLIAVRRRPVLDFSGDSSDSRSAAALPARRAGQQRTARRQGRLCRKPCGEDRRGRLHAVSGRSVQGNGPGRRHLSGRGLPGRSLHPRGHSGRPMDERARDHSADAPLPDAERTSRHSAARRPDGDRAAEEPCRRMGNRPASGRHHGLLGRRASGLDGLDPFRERLAAPRFLDPGLPGHHDGRALHA